MARRTVLDELIVKLRSDPNVAGITRFEKRIDAARQRMNAIGTSAVRLGAALTAAGTASALEFAGFEAKLAEIEGLVGISRDVLEQQKEDILAIADETGQAPTQLADALFYIYSAGARGQAAIDLLRHSAQAAAAGLGDQATVADVVTSALNVYTGGVLDSKSAIDQLVAAIREGKLDPESLSAPLASVLPFAADAKVEFGEVAGAMAAMSKQGIQASRGATALQSIFARVLRPGPMGIKALDAVGLKIEDVRAAMEQDLFGALMMLRTAYGEDRDGLAQFLQDREAMIAVFSLTGDAAEDNAQVIRSVAEAEGTLAAAFGAGNETLRREWRKTVAAFRGSAGQVGEAQGPGLVDMMQKLQALAIGFRSLPQPVKEFIGTLLSLGPVVLGLGVGLKGLAWALGPLAKILVWAYKSKHIRKALIGILKVAKRLGPVLVRAFSAAGPWLARLVPWLLRIGALLLALPGWVVLAAAAVAAVAIVLIRHWSEIKTFFIGLWTAIVDGLRDAWSQVTALFSALWTAITAGGRAAVDGLLRIAGYHPVALLVKHWDKVKAFFAGLWEFISEGFLNLDLFEAGRRLMQALADGLRAAGGWIWDTLTAIFEKAGELLPSSDARYGPFSRLTDAGRAIVETVSAGIRSAQPVDRALLDGAFRLPRLDQIAPQLPVGPVPFQAAAAAAGSTSVSLNIQSGAIVVHGAGQDPEAIARAVREEFERATAEEWRALAEHADSTESA